MKDITLVLMSVNKALISPISTATAGRLRRSSNGSTEISKVLGASVVILTNDKNRKRETYSIDDDTIVLPQERHVGTDLFEK